MKKYYDETIVCDDLKITSFPIYPNIKEFYGKNNQLTEIQPEMLNQLMMNAYISGVSDNIVPVYASHFDANLPPNSCDLILMVDTYHECVNPPAILSGLRRALKPYGRLVLVEYRSEDSWIPSIYDDHRMSINQAKMELESNGFLLTQISEFLPWQHILIFSKI